MKRGVPFMICWFARKNRARSAYWLFLFTAIARVLTHAGLFQHHLERAEICERRLQQVKADEGREPEPVLAVKVREKQAQ